MSKGGYAGKYLDVNLTSGVLKPVTLPDEVLSTWLGCTGLGLHLLSQEIAPGMKATDPDVPVFVLTGPLTGTAAPMASNWTIVTLNTVLPYHPGVSQAHGYFGARLRHAGWDGVFIRGISAEPVYLWIDDDRAALRDARGLWGKDTFESQRLVVLELGDPERKSVSVACIGQGGEAMLPGASVRADWAYGASKGGPGVIWGAKRLKAIAVRGTGQIPIADGAAFSETCNAWREHWKNTVGKTKQPARGIKIMPDIAAFGGFPGKNFSDPEYAVRWGEGMREHLQCWKIKEVGSFGCDLQCHNETTVTTGPFSGYTVTGYTGEVIEEVGPNLGVDDPGTALMLCGYFDGLGLDCAEVPRIIAMMMEAYNTGRLTRKDTDGIDLTWGNYEGIIELTEKTLRREGIGAIVAKGLREAGADLGIEDLAVHIKGVGFNTHDQRAWGIGWLFGSIMSGIGPSWQGVGVERRPEPDLGFPESQNPSSPVDKGRQSYLTQMKKLWDDCYGCCWFASWELEGAIKYATRAVSHATGWNVDRERALLLGERIINLQRLLSLYLGFKPESEFDVASRVSGAVPSGPATGWELGPYLKEMREEYYATAGWDPVTGTPDSETLKRTGLDGYTVGRRSMRM
jgi:aldehyde:ferredoxin oxidoreductase